jgi:hypothetical protein
MDKNKVETQKKRLVLTRETIRTLDEHGLEVVAGGQRPCIGGPTWASGTTPDGTR